MTSGERAVDAGAEWSVPPALRAERWFAAFLIFSQVYYFHRWFFKYGDEGTSPTYSTTPVAWQAGKYVIIGLLTVWLVVVLLHSPRRARESGGFSWVVAGILVLCVLITTVNATRAELPDVARQVADWSFLPLVLLMPLFWRGERSLDLLVRVGAVLVAYHLVFEAVQVVAFLGFDRLPALGYPDGGLVRFGGGLDDPNGFGLVVVLPIVVTLALRPDHRWRSTSLVALMLATLVLTFSYSALAALVVGMAVYSWLGRDPIPGVAMALGAAVTAVFVVATDRFQQVIADKAASALSRFDSSRAMTGQYSVSDYFPQAGAIDVGLGVPDLTVHSENSYLLLTSEYGVLVPLLMGAAAILTVVHGARRTRSQRTAGEHRSSRLSAALTAYVAAFAVASLGVPSLNVFPVNVTFWVAAMALWLPTSDQATPDQARSASSMT